MDTYRDLEFYALARPAGVKDQGAAAAGDGPEGVPGDVRAPKFPA